MHIEQIFCLSDSVWGNHHLQFYIYLQKVTSWLLSWSYDCCRLIRGASVTTDCHGKLITTQAQRSLTKSAVSQWTRKNTQIVCESKKINESLASFSVHLQFHEWFPNKKIAQLLSFLSTSNSPCILQKIWHHATSFWLDVFPLGVKLATLLYAKIIGGKGQDSRFSGRICTSDEAPLCPQPGH